MCVLFVLRKPVCLLTQYSDRPLSPAGKVGPMLQLVSDPEPTLCLPSPDVLFLLVVSLERLTISAVHPWQLTLSQCCVSGLLIYGFTPERVYGENCADIRFGRDSVHPHPAIKGAP